MRIVRWTCHSSAKILVGLLGICCVLAAYYNLSLIWTIQVKPLPQGISIRHIYTGEDFVQVLITSGEHRLSGAVTLVNSIRKNTQEPVHFYFVTDNKSAHHLSSWIENSNLKEISYEIKVFSPDVLDFANPSDQPNLINENAVAYSKIYISKLFPNIKGRLICLDDDIIIQGDIGNLRNMSISSNHIGALSLECDAVSKHFNNGGNRYSHFLNLQNPRLKDLHIDGNACTFNLGVIVLNMMLWNKENITEQLSHWMKLNEKENIFKKNSILPPFLVVLNNRITSLDNSWHVKHLGVTSGSRYSRNYLSEANLLHWDGYFKPWKKKSPHSELWRKYYVSDPTDKHDLNKVKLKT